MNQYQLTQTQADDLGRGYQITVALPLGIEDTGDALELARRMLPDAGKFVDSAEKLELCVRPTRDSSGFARHLGAIIWEEDGPDRIEKFHYLMPAIVAVLKPQDNPLYQGKTRAARPRWPALPEGLFPDVPEPLGVKRTDG